MLSQDLSKSGIMLNRAAELRSYLDRLESLVGRIGYGLGNEGFEIPKLMDQASSLLARAPGSEPLYPEEQIRFEEVSAQLKKKAPQFLKEIGGADALAALSKSLALNEDQWWWLLDRKVKTDRQASLKKILIGTGIIVAVLVILGVVYQRFLAPDKASTDQYEHLSNADLNVQNGDLQKALDEVNLALEAKPGDPEVLIYKGVLLQELGKTAEAEQVFTQAQQSYPKVDQFLVARGMRYTGLGYEEIAIQDAQAAIQINPESAEAYLVLGQAYEGLGKLQEAGDAYTQASTLADKQNKPQLVAFVRMRLAMMMQRMGVPTNYP